ncbi:MAG: NUDIX domain-containing protein [Clostridium sp.]|nr:NUDIX domain-containing protein [Clostridium sp.]
MDMTIKTAEGYFNYRVAAVITHNQKLLVMKNNDYHSYYLPGGRVQMHESSQEAIVREIKEELHINIKECRPLWFHECFFVEDVLEEKFHELCMYYFVDIHGTGFDMFDDTFTLAEGNRLNTFEWIAFEELSNQIVYPLFIKDEIYSLPDSLTIRIDEEYER